MADAYGQTDVMNDPRWIMANMAGRRPGDPVYRQMEAALKAYELRQGLEMHDEQLNEQMMSREGMAAAARAQRDEALSQRESEAKSRESDRALAREDLMSRSEESRKIRESAEQDRRLNALTAYTSSPAFLQAHGKNAPQVANQLMASELAKMGLNVNTTGSPTGSTNPELAKWAAATGKTGGQPTSGGTNAASPAATTAAAPPATGGEGFSPSGLVAGQSPPPQPEWKEQLQGGLVKTHLPSGGTSTTFEPTTPEGVAKINEARAQTAARSAWLEAHPEPFASGNMAATQGVVSFPKNLPPAPQGSFEPIQLATNTKGLAQPGTGVPLEKPEGGPNLSPVGLSKSLFNPSSLATAPTAATSTGAPIAGAKTTVGLPITGGPVGAPPPVAAAAPAAPAASTQPQPSVLPSPVGPPPTGPFSGSIGQITNPPPQAPINRPPASPRALTDEERQRLVANANPVNPGY